MLALLKLAVACLCLSTAFPQVSAQPSKRVDVLVPFYVYPPTYETSPSIPIYDALAATAKANSKCVRINAIVTGDTSGPPAADLLPFYIAAFKQLSSNGVKLYGYVHSMADVASSTPRPLNELLAEINTWFTQMKSGGVPLAGIFIDEVASTFKQGTGDALAFYKNLTTTVKKLRGKSILNPGTRTSCSIANLADIYVRFDSYNSDYKTATSSRSLTCDCSKPSRIPGSVIFRKPVSSTKCAAVVHTDNETKTVAAYAAKARQAANNNFNFLYITDLTLPNPWNKLSSTWAQELGGLAAHNRATRNCFGFGK